MENDANLANYAELGEHIKRLGLKARGQVKGSEGYGETVEDLEDYYERLVQMKSMRADTLQCELVEVERLKKQKEEALQQASQRAYISFGCIFFMLLAALEDHYPGLISNPSDYIFKLVWESTPALIFISCGATNWATRRWNGS